MDETLPIESESQKKKKRRARIILIVLIVAGVATWLFIQAGDIKNLRGGAFYDQSAEKIQEDIDHEVEDGYFNMSINTSVPVYGDNNALIGIKNIASNHYDCIVTVTLEDGTEIFKSGGIAPGNELEVVTLNRTLDAGEHKATALFEIYEQDDKHTKVGQTASKITLHVQ